MLEPVVYLSCLACGEVDAQCYTGFARSLSDGERARALSLPEARRREFVAAHGLLRWQLAALLSVSAEQLVFRPQPPHGKPQLHWPQVPDIDVNISHADGMVVSAVGRAARVGVDLEPVGRKVGRAVIERYFAEPEQRWLAGCDDPQASAIMVWTLKEAVAKALGLGLQAGFSEFAVLPDPPRLLVLPPALGPTSGWWLQQWRQLGDQWCALAAQAAAAPRLCWVAPR
jgi:4'-phosphopantetheinyl transferase